MQQIIIKFWISSDHTQYTSESGYSILVQAALHVYSRCRDQSSFELSQEPCPTGGLNVKMGAARDAWDNAIHNFKTYTHKSQKQKRSQHFKAD